MRPFKYVRPKALDDVLGLLETHGPAARILAGGTDVVVRLRMGFMKPDIVIDIKDVSELSDRIVDRGSFVRIGSRVVMTDLIGDARVRQQWPALVEAASVVGSVQIRNRATLAGNICNASPAADTAPALLVYGAIVNLAGPSSVRSVPLAEFFKGPGRTALVPGELVASIDLPVAAARSGAAFGRITRRFGVDLATINLCCRIDEAGDTRFAYGAVAPTPILVVDDGGRLGDVRASEDAKTAALQALIDRASPISDVRGGRDYRLAMLGVMSRRALQSARDRLDAQKTGA